MYAGPFLKRKDNEILDSQQKASIYFFSYNINSFHLILYEITDNKCFKLDIYYTRLAIILQNKHARLCNVILCNIFLLLLKQIYMENYLILDKTLDKL